MGQIFHLHLALKKASINDFLIVFCLTYPVFNKYNNIRILLCAYFCHSFISNKKKGYRDKAMDDKLILPLNLPLIALNY